MNNTNDDTIGKKLITYFPINKYSVVRNKREDQINMYTRSLTCAVFTGAVFTHVLFQNTT